jgi:hypothetical protein
MFVEALLALGEVLEGLTGGGSGRRCYFTAAAALASGGAVRAQRGKGSLL